MQKVKSDAKSFTFYKNKKLINLKKDDKNNGS